MNEFWGWLGEQFGNVIGVLGLIAGAWFYWLSRKPKTFGWEFLSKTRILSRESNLLPLKVVYDGKDVVSPNIIVVRIGNTGKAEIRAQDFDGPVLVVFPSAKILSASISGRSDANIRIELDPIGPSAVAFIPPLLNAGEWIDIQFVTDGSLQTPMIEARVAGLSGTFGDAQKSRKRVWQPVYWGALGLLAVGPFLWFLAFGQEQTVVPAIVLLIGGAGLMFLAGSQMRTSSVWAKQDLRLRKDLSRR